MIFQDTAAPKGFFEVLVSLIDAVVWPVTLLIILILFRKNFGEAIQRLGSLKADKTGISLTFQSKLDKAKGLFKGIGAKSISKSSELGVNTSSSFGSPKEQLLGIHNDIETRLKNIAKENNIDVTSNNAHQVCNTFKEIGVFDLQKAELTKTLLDLTASPDAMISQQQVDEVKSLYQAIAF